MTLSGMETILRAVRYSGFFSKRVEFSRVEASSEEIFVSRLLTCEGAQEGQTIVSLLELRLRWKVRHDYYCGCLGIK